MELLLLLSFIVAVIVLFFFHLYHSSYRRHGNLPPGRVGMPLVGETLRLIAAYKASNPEPFIDDRVRLHGRIFTTHVFGERTVFSADPDFNRVVLAGEGRSFECSYPSSIATLLGSSSLLIMKAPLHKRMHSLTVARFASLSLLKSSLLRDVDRLVRLALGSWTDGQTLSLLDQTKKITFDLTVKQLMSREPGEWSEALRREYVMLIDGFFSIPVRSALLPFTTYGRAIKARTKVAETLRGAIRERREEKRHQVVDMLDELMEAEEGLCEEETMVDFLLALLVAGYETTPTIMTLVVKFLSENPRALSILKVP